MGKYSVEWLRKELVRECFKDYEDRAHLHSVLYKGEFYSFTFLQKTGEHIVIASIYAYERGAYDRLRRATGGVHKVAFHLDLTEEDGNQLWKALNTVKKVSKNNKDYYKLEDVLNCKISDSLRAAINGIKRRCFNTMTEETYEDED